MHRIVILAVWALTGVADADAGQWTQFRGPDAGAIADDPNLPDTWSETENVVWKIGVPGLSWSSPILQ